MPDGGGGGGDGSGEDNSPRSIPNGDAKPRKGLYSLPSSASLYGTDVVVEEHRQLVESIARHIVYGKLLRHLSLHLLACRRQY